MQTVVIALVIVAVVAGAIVLVMRARRTATTHRHAADIAATALAEQSRSSAGELEVRGLILASMEEGVLLFDRGGDRVFANEALARHLGDDAPGKVALLLPTALRDAVRRAGYAGTIVRADVETGAPTRWLRATAQPVGTDGSVLLVVRDVTEARRLDAVRRDFVANASHELKTPVASIRATAETLHDGAIDDPVAARRFTEQLERDADRLSRIVSDLLDLSRLEAGSDRDALVALDAVAAEVVERRRGDATTADVELTLATDGVPMIPGSTRDLGLLVGNLVDNAIHYTQPGGRVDVEVRAHPDAVSLRVSDSGVGIPQRDVPRIFERFYRVDQARSRATGGTGLGLAIVKHVCENHGGEVSVTSELGRGSTFEVTLPTANVGVDTP